MYSGRDSERETNCRQGTKQMSHLMWRIHVPITRRAGIRHWSVLRLIVSRLTWRHERRYCWALEIEPQLEGKNCEAAYCLLLRALMGHFDDTVFWWDKCVSCGALLKNGMQDKSVSLDKLMPDFAEVPAVIYRIHITKRVYVTNAATYCGHLDDL